MSKLAQIDSVLRCLLSPPAALLGKSKVPQEDIKDVSLVIRRDRATISEGKQTSEGEIRVNTAAKPKQIDTKYLSGPEKDLTTLGIYELDGDTLRICHTSPLRTARSARA
jgi:uncharacterized protein (TIGR03067 family)